MSVILISLVLVSITYLLFHYFTRTFNYWKNKNVAGPKPIILFGNLYESALRRKNIGIVFKEIYENFPNEKIVGVYRMTTPALLIRDLDLIKHVMIKDFDVFADRGIEFSKEGLGANLFHADGETWRVLRNNFTPIFTSGKLKNMLYLMTERGDKFVNYVEQICVEQPEQEIHELVQKYTIASISACAFGVDIDTLNDKLETFIKMDQLLSTPNFAIELDMMFPGILRKINSSLFPEFVTKFFNELVKNVITQRNGVPSNRNDFMDLILQLRQEGELQGTKRNADYKTLSLKITDDLIAAQAFVFYAGGYETSATTMSFLLYELAKNPHIQDKLIAEIDDVLKKHNGKVTYDAINEMVYLDQAFSETLRLYPIVEPLQRNAQVDYTFPGTNVTVKQGQTVLISPMGIHHDEKYFPNPEKFDPERFTPAEVGRRHPCAYIPFGIGPRNCIGMRFAKVQSRICMAKLLSKVRVESSKNTPRIMTINPNRVIIGPGSGVYLNIVKRN